VSGDDEQPIDAMWNADTFTERTCDMLAIAAVELKGNIGSKPRADGLYQIKDGLYWWAVRFIPKFSTIFGGWHNTVTATIHKIALNLGKSQLAADQNVTGRAADTTRPFIWTMSRFKRSPARSL